MYVFSVCASRLVSFCCFVLLCICRCCRRRSLHFSPNILWKDEEGRRRGTAFYMNSCFYALLLLLLDRWSPLCISKLLLLLLLSMMHTNIEAFVVFSVSFYAVSLSARSRIALLTHPTSPHHIFVFAPPHHTTPHRIRSYLAELSPAPALSLSRSHSAAIAPSCRHNQINSLLRLPFCLFAFPPLFAV